MTHEKAHQRPDHRALSRRLLDVLPRRVDRRRYILKGGANLRYFFGSERYSEDLDLDLSGEPPWRLREKVDAILAGGPLPLLLRKAGTMQLVVAGALEGPQ